MKYLFLTLLMTLSAPSFGASATKIAVIDMQSAIKSTKKGRSAAKTLEKFAKAEREAIEKIGKGLEAKQKQFLADQKVLKPQALQKKYAGMEKKFMEFSQKQKMFSAVIGKKERELLAPIVEGLQRSAKKVAEKKGYDFVMDKSAMIYFNPKFDLTNEVVKSFGG